MPEPIDRMNLLSQLCEKCGGGCGEDKEKHCWKYKLIMEQPTIEAEPVTHCKDCIYFKPEHVKCPDGTEKDYSEFPAEAFEPNFNLGVTAAYGINVGSQCIYDEWCGAYSDDKTVFRRADDYCSRGKRKTEVDKNVGSIHAE